MSKNPQRGPDYTQLRRAARFVRARFASLCWLALIAVHVPGIVTTIRNMSLTGFDGGGVMRCAAMLIALTYFVLKLADVHVFRLTPGWRSSVCLMLVVALLHLGAVHRAVMPGSELPHEEIVCLVLCGAMWTNLRCFRAWVRHLSEWVLWLLACPRPICRSSRWVGRQSHHGPVFPFASLSWVLAPRAPPFPQ